MKTIYSVFAVAAASLLMGACSKEHPFVPDNSTTGQVLKAALDVTSTGDQMQITRAESNGYKLDDFNIAFIKQGNTTPSKSFTYGEMPDVVDLTSGQYTVTATYGEDRIAEWENPYFLGRSEVFEVKPMEITSYIEPIECSLQNVKVTIEYGSALFASMGDDAYVEVRVSNNDGLQFGKSERRAGYFRHTAESTLVATFHGDINGAHVVETKSYKGVQKGCWYKLTFKLHGGSGSGTGNTSGSVSVDASVDVIGVDGEITIAEDEPLDDNERPGEGDDPNPPTPPDEPGDGPEIIAISPGMVFDTPWNVTGSTPCEFKIISKAESGFEELTCDIVSDSLTPESLFGIGLSSHLDLISCIREDGESIEGALSNLGFPVNMGGKKEAIFNISNFMGLMASQFPGQRHEFHLHVKDANGEKDAVLILQF